MKIVTFILENLDYLLMVIFAIVSVIASFFSFINKHKNKKSERFSGILRNLPEVLSIAESFFPNLGEKTGEHKRFTVMSYLESLCDMYNLPFDEDYWSSQIESILSSPQKHIKEVSNHETKKDS